MPSIVLTGPSLILTLAANKDKTMVFLFGSGLQLVPQATVGSTVYADGGVRKTRTPGWQRRWQATVSTVTQDQADLLWRDAAHGGWLGETVWLRDFRGNKFAGYWDPPTLAVHDYDTESEVSLTVNEVTLSEAV